MVFGKKKPSEPAEAKPVMAKDPVCGVVVDASKPGTFTVKFFDTPFYFDSLKCLGEFEKDPYKFGKKK